MRLELMASAWAQDAAAPAAAEKGGAGGMAGLFLPMILVFVIFYFLMIRPQQKQQKKHRELLTQLKRGDEVVTAGGIHGTVTAITDTVVTVEIADNVRIKVDKPQIAQVKNSAPAAPAKA